MKYLFLGLAIAFELLGSSFLKVSNGFSKLIPSVVTIISFIICFYFLSLALRFIPLSVAYAIWGGLGIVLTTAISVIIFKQSLDLPAVIGITLIVLGVIIMNVFSKAATH
ncbi:multidrug efflux SMR transporter [Sphingobacterium sp. SRCM116780]|uniref:DMT family transporter n=1 Tax=Sphingobacterium sp. SRCM116780 TaxID=2907623 RepID=UPI001F21A86C|nr:multidrug efflux SMR transporter [Sphingobacterium sp. SRCM116780]UIR57999.1 multidrug efflux SMR transporter [Sphingobacterium sp. SRCM116780]